MYNLAVSILTIVICTLFFWIRWRKKRMSLFQRYGIPGPKPNIFTGNIIEFHEKRHKCINEWMEKYGKIFGFFLGAKPYMICSDVELIKTIQIKKFKNFTNKDFLLPDAGVPHKLTTSFLELQRDEEWKNTRNILRPLFSTGKIKMMSTLMHDPLNIFLKNIEKQKESYFDIVEFYKKLTFDIICRSAFGITTNVQKNETSKFVQSVYQLLETDSSEVLSALSICFPEFEPIPTYLRTFQDILRKLFNLPSVRLVFDTCKQIVESRKKSQYHPPDLLQTIIDAEGDSGDELKKLSTDYVIANSVGFMAAGYDVVSVGLGWCTYLIAKHPKIQEKVRGEINENIKDSENIQYSDLINFKYMDQVISESFRLFPFPIIVINRICAKDFKFKDVTIPKGVIISIPVSNLHKDPNYWQDPEKFDPDRFSTENKAKIDPIIYQPFGAGPRMCLGIRLAQTIMKLILANLIRSYMLQLYEDEEMEFEYSLFLSRPKNGIKIKAIPISDTI